MLDTEVYLEKLALFGRLLRQQGMEVSPKENSDACSILLSLDMSDRETVKTALRTVYAKSRDEQLKFDRVFDSFFLSEEAIRAIDKRHQKEELERRKAMEEAEQALSEQTPNVLYSEAQKEAYSKLSEEEKRRLEELKKRMKGTTDRSVPLYTDFIRSVFMKYILEQQIKMEDAAIGAQAIDPEIGILFKDISDFHDNEIPKAVKYMQDLSSRITGELAKRRKGAKKSGSLDFRRTIRKSLETGGSLHKLAYKPSRKRKKQLVILCDVSASMVQFSEFALRFIQALNEASESSRVFLFSEELKEADPFHLQNMDAFRDYVRESGVYGKGTDLGAALKKINDERPSVLSPASVLILVSDCKSIDIGGACREMDRSRVRAGKVYCLNPLPESKWKYSSSVMALSQKCTMLSCSTLRDLGEACRRLTLS